MEYSEANHADGCSTRLRFGKCTENSFSKNYVKHLKQKLGRYFTVCQLRFMSLEMLGSAIDGRFVYFRKSISLQIAEFSSSQPPTTSRCEFRMSVNSRLDVICKQLVTHWKFNLMTHISNEMETQRTPPGRCLLLSWCVHYVNLPILKSNNFVCWGVDLETKTEHLIT